jgi:hypothetical protein
VIIAPWLSESEKKVCHHSGSKLSNSGTSGVVLRLHISGGATTRVRDTFPESYITKYKKTSPIWNQNCPLMDVGGRHETTRHAPWPSESEMKVCSHAGRVSHTRDMWHSNADIRHAILIEERLTPRSNQ